VKRSIARIIAVSAVLVLVTTGTAEAHVMSWDTNLTLKANDTTVKKGTVVKFTARLTSAKRTCFANRKVQLLRNGVVVGAQRTNSLGKVIFYRTIRFTARWKARFRGFVFGVHPHVHTCLASTSNVIRVRVIGN
jgi:hypothetical protein